MHPTRREFVHLLGLGGAAAALSGCDETTEALVSLLDRAPPDVFAAPSTGEIDLASHVLNRLTWGPTLDAYERLRGMGIDAFIDEQLHPEGLDDRRCDRRVASIESLTEPAAELYEHDDRALLLDLSRYKLLRGVYSRRQLFEVMVDFWTDHFNIITEKGDCRWLKAADDRDVIRAGALGRFRTLLRASALSPAMLIYLDGHANRVEREGDRPNENYARELLELHTLGVHGGYEQRDVSETARCLSGWRYEHRPFRFRAARVWFDPARHDDGEKRVLGQVIPAGEGAADLERVLDIVCEHPATARHLAGKLCRRFVDDAPPPDAVTATAEAFRRSDGEIRVTLGALFRTEAFRARRGNLFKRPLRYVLSALRACDARTNAAPALMASLDRMGHAPFQYPTPDGYPLEPAPWLGTLLWRWNFALTLERGGFAGTRVNADRLVTAFDGIEGAAAHLLGRRPSELERVILGETRRPVALMLASPAFQRH